MRQQTPATVLVVDDEPDITAILRDYLVAADLAALCAIDGRQALEVLRNQPVDAVVLDVMMRSLDRMRSNLRHRQWSERWQAFQDSSTRHTLWGAGSAADLSKWDACGLPFARHVSTTLTTASTARMPYPIKPAMKAASAHPCHCYCC